MLRKKIVENFSSFVQPAKNYNNYVSLWRMNYFNKNITNSFIRLCLKQKYQFGVSIKDMKITYDPTKKTEIISLNQSGKKFINFKNSNSLHL